MASAKDAQGEKTGHRASQGGAWTDSIDLAWPVVILEHVQGLRWTRSAGGLEAWAWAWVGRIG